MFQRSQGWMVLTAAWCVICAGMRVDMLYAQEDVRRFSAGRFEVCGEGDKRYFGFRLWQGRFYLDQDAQAGEVLSDVAKRLEIQYLLRIPAAEIARATEIGIRNNVSAQMYAQLKDRIDLANSLWPNVTEGDRYEVTYIPGRGTAFVFNGQLQQIIEGNDFAFAFFSIWVGDNPIDRKLSRQLLRCQ